MRDAVSVGFDVQFEFFVLLDDMLFDVLDVDAGVFNGNGFLAAGNFDRKASRLRVLSGRLGRRRGWILCGGANGGRCEKNQHKTWKFWPRKVHVPVDPIFHGNTMLRQVTPLRTKMQTRNGMLLGWKSQSGDGTMYSKLHVDAAYLTHWFCSCNFGICPAGSWRPQAQR